MRTAQMTFTKLVDYDSLSHASIVNDDDWSKSTPSAFEFIADDDPPDVDEGLDSTCCKECGNDFINDDPDLTDCDECGSAMCPGCAEERAGICTSCQVKAQQQEAANELANKKVCAACGTAIIWHSSLYKCQACRRNPIYTRTDDDPPYLIHGGICTNCKGDPDLHRCKTHTERYIKRMKPTIPWIDEIAEVRTQRKQLFPSEVHDNMDGYREIAIAWGIDHPTRQPLVCGFADYYLLEAMTSSVFAPTVADDSHLRLVVTEAMKMAQIHRDYWTDQLMAYYDMIVGGELRHAPTIGRLIRIDDSSRMNSWLTWKVIRERYGTLPLDLAIDYFLKLKTKGYGGPLWSAIARLVRARETNQITKHSFLDQAWSITHNGGLALNKLSWGQGAYGFDKTLQIVQHTLGPAQASNPTRWSTLASWASPQVRGLLRQFVPAANQARRVHRMPLLEIKVRSLHEMDLSQWAFHHDLYPEKVMT